MKNLVKNIKITRETLRIVREGRYRTSSGREVMLPSPSGYGVVEIVDTQQNRESAAVRKGYPIKLITRIILASSLMREGYKCAIIQYPASNDGGGKLILAVGCLRGRMQRENI